MPRPNRLLFSAVIFLLRDGKLAFGEIFSKVLDTFAVFRTVLRGFARCVPAKKPTESEHLLPRQTPQQRSHHLGTRL